MIDDFSARNYHTHTSSHREFKRQARRSFATPAASILESIMALVAAENWTIVVAISQNGVIGRENDLPWRLKRDLCSVLSKTR